MSQLTDLRRELADDVAGTPADLTVYDHVPARVQLPAAFVMPGSPYVEQGDTFGSSTVRFDAVLLTFPSLNREQTDQLDELIDQTSRRLAAAEWLIESIRQPELQDLNGQQVLAVSFAVACTVTFPEPN